MFGSGNGNSKDYEVYEDYVEEYGYESYGDGDNGSYTDDLDYCNKDMTVYDYEGSTCNHSKFKNLPPINKIKGFTNEMMKPCCQSHGYLFTDECKV